ncbi:hypothetical protein C8Q70DRAFT_1031233 [Cubamyces menziesii]|uniref:Pali-domain-containing protein n=1 Tax=Trametes cubensis TaxID=1111947 RepID=A0AAD7TQD4_9APHY|nr:hypothetical protein C8Q70DRAFT_1031233 [Cubamyces menziesii]KAJ8474285.1 hypothetical protein ONZ51_g7324 [Trametes cubensis]
MVMSLCCLRRSRDSDSQDSDGPKPRRHPRPLARHLGISLATCAVLLASFILFLLLGLSLPIIKSIYLFTIQFATNPNLPATSIATRLRLGVWGICAYSTFDSPDDMECFGPMLGYTIPEQILELTGYPALVQDVGKGVTVLLVLHLVAAGLAFVGVFTSLFLESHTMCIISLLSTIFTLIVGLVVFGVDLALILVGKDRIGPLTEFNYVANWGPALWMVLTGVVLSFVGMILMSIVVCECCGVGRKHRGRHHHNQEKC